MRLRLLSFLLVLASLTTKPALAADDRAIAVPYLRAVVIQPNGKTAKQIGDLSVSAENIPLLQRPSFYTLMKPFIGQALSFGRMKDLTHAISTFYRLQGHAFVTVSVPPQRVHDGVLHIDVTEYRLGRVTVHGNKWFSDGIIRYQSGLEPGDHLNLNHLQTDLDWLNTNPFCTIDMIYRPSAVPGLTDVDLHVADRFPVYVYSGITNQTDPSLGRLNWNAGISWGNAFGLGQILTYQFSRTFEGRYDSHVASWTIPVSAHNALLIYGTYSVTYPIANQPLSNKGVSGQASIRWMHMNPHIALGKNFGLDGKFLVGFDWKTTNSDQFYVQTPIVVSNADTDQFVIGYIGSVQDPWGQFQINNQLVYGPSGLTHYDNEQDYNTIFPGAKPNYVYDRLVLTRNTTLPAGFTSTTRLGWQGATHNLLYSEQLMTGGMGNARGYYVNTSFGSRALTFSEEINTPEFSFGKFMHFPILDDHNTFGVFWDWTDNTQVHPIPGAQSMVVLSSAGVDLNSRINEHLTVTFDSGWRLRHARDTGKRGVFCDFSVVAGF